MVHDVFEHSRHTKCFALFFYVCRVHFFLLYRIHKEFLSARSFKSVLHKKYVKNVIILPRVSYKYFQCFDHIYSKSSQTGLKFTGIFTCSSICDHKKDKSKFLCDGLFRKCSIQLWTLSLSLFMIVDF